MIEVRTNNNNEFNQRVSVYEGSVTDETEVTGHISKPLNKKFPENTPAGRLQKRVPNVPVNLLELIYMKKCTECGSILATICGALAHYNGAKHQTKLAFLFMSHGIYNLSLSKEEIHEIEVGISTGIGLKMNLGPLHMTIRELVKKFNITEDLKKLDLNTCRLCKCSFHSKIAALRHYGSKIHKKKQENEPLYNPLGCYGKKDDMRCDLCNVKVSGDGVLESHLTSQKHTLKMEAYIEAMALGRIPVPMSSRGFYDFNNVEREEANPFDPSKFLEEQESPVIVGMSQAMRQDIGLGRSTYEPSSYQGGFTVGFMSDYRQPGFGAVGQGMSMVTGGAQYGMIGGSMDGAMNRVISGGMGASMGRSMDGFMSGGMGASMGRSMDGSMNRAIGVGMGGAMSRMVDGSISRSMDSSIGGAMNRTMVGGDMSYGHVGPGSWGGRQTMGAVSMPITHGLQYAHDISTKKTSVNPSASQIGPTKFQYTNKRP